MGGRCQHLFSFSFSGGMYGLSLYVAVGNVVTARVSEGLTMGTIIWYTMYIMRKIIKKHDLDCPDFLQGVAIMLLPALISLVS